MPDDTCETINDGDLLRRCAAVTVELSNRTPYAHGCCFFCAEPEDRPHNRYCLWSKAHRLAGSRPRCSIEGCDGVPKARGWCGKHYRKWRLFGTPLGEKVPPPLQRWWSKWEVNPSTGCWEWTAGRDKDGYGKFSVGRAGSGVHLRAHRWGYEALTGEIIPPDMTIDHLCKVRSCVYPPHLEVVSSAENTRRARADRRTSHG